MVLVDANNSIMKKMEYAHKYAEITLVLICNVTMGTLMMVMAAPLNVCLKPGSAVQR